MKSTTVATLFAIIGTTTAFNAQPNRGRHSHPNTASYNSLRDMATYPETFENGFGRGNGQDAFDDGNWRTNAGYSQGPGGFMDMETNPYYDEGWSQSARASRPGESFGRRGGGPMGGGPMGMGGGPGGPMGGHHSADGFDPFGAYSPDMGMSRSDRRMDQGGDPRSDRTMSGFTYDGRQMGGMERRREGYGMDPGMMFEDPDFGPPGMMGGPEDMGMMGGPGMGMGMGSGQGMGRMGP